LIRGHQLGHEQPAVHLPDKPGKVQLAAFEDQILIAARAAGRPHPELARE